MSYQDAYWDFAARQFIAKHQPSSTTKAYARYWQLFVSFCNSVNRLPLPARQSTVVVFMQWMASRNYARSTINHAALSAISRQHTLAGLPSPTRGLLTKLGKRIITKITPPPKAKLPLTLAHLLKMYAALKPTPTWIDQRDYYMFLLMFTGFLREAEVVNLLEHDVWVAT